MTRLSSGASGQTRGFSLVELSIVLVILGLLTGGVLAGQSLIRSAELRATVSELSQYQTASANFLEKYGSLPGDFPIATDYWGIRAGSTGNDITCRHSINSYTGTCNGDGNGKINESHANDTVYERFLHWQHLALAGMIEGKYTGASTSTTLLGEATANINAPATTASRDKVYLPVYLGPVSGSTEWFDGTWNIHLYSSFSPLTPQELWTIDTKVDDGKPATGRVFTYKSTGTWAPNCATSAAVTAEYNVTANNKNCVFSVQFP